MPSGVQDIGIDGRNRAGAAPGPAQPATPTGEHGAASAGRLGGGSSRLGAASSSVRPTASAARAALQKAGLGALRVSADATDRGAGGRERQLRIGDVVHFMHCRKKGPPQVLKESFGVVVTDELVVTKNKNGRLPEEAYGVVDVRSGELTRRSGTKMVKVERVLGNAHRERGRPCCSVLDLLDLELPCVSEIVCEIFFVVEPIPRAQLESLIDTRNNTWKHMLEDRKHVRKIISMLMTCKHNTHVLTWKHVTALGKVFIEQTLPEKLLCTAPCLAPCAAPDQAEYDDVCLAFDEGPSFDELLAELKAEARDLKGG